MKAREWKPFSHFKPSCTGCYLVTEEYGKRGIVSIARWGTGDLWYDEFASEILQRVTAWQELPEPYRKGE